jgi:hypothetical protein
MWDRLVVEKIEKCVVACSFKSVIANVEWVFVGVYGPNDDVERTDLWPELAGLMSIWMPQCFWGGGGGGGGFFFFCY